MRWSGINFLQLISFTAPSLHDFHSSTQSICVAHKRRAFCRQWRLTFYRAMLRWVRYCYGKSSVRLSVCPWRWGIVTNWQSHYLFTQHQYNIYSPVTKLLPYSLSLRLIGYRRHVTGWWVAGGITWLRGRLIAADVKHIASFTDKPRTGSSDTLNYCNAVTLCVC